uniref:Uncharacterized protein n=1 Tax=Arundo donax TaxID=35708 RepID=A0A0A8ZL99_ARUDO
MGVPISGSSSVNSRQAGKQCSSRIPVIC